MLAHHAVMSKSSVHHGTAEGGIRQNTNDIKPNLTEVNKVKRLKFFIYMIDIMHIGYINYQFNDMMNFIYFDEKFSYITQRSTSFYILLD